MHSEALTDKGKEIFPKLSKFEGFYLAGGTALALQIGHRISIDFDFFTGEKIKRTLLAKAEDIFSPSSLEVLVNNSGELTFVVEEVKTTFLTYPFPEMLPKVEIQEASFKLLSIKELAASKACTIGRRGELKDYVDIYFILKEEHATLSEIFELAAKKYGETFDTRLFLEQLLYLDDVEDVKIQFLKKPVLKSEIKEFFEEHIRSVEVA